MTPFAGNELRHSDVRAPSVTFGGHTFVVPYNFAPFFSAHDDHELGQRAPSPLDRLHEDEYRGTLTLSITARQPLLVLELSHLEGEGQDVLRVYRTRRTADGKPLIQGASLKGSLRHLYRAATGSRLDAEVSADPLTHRMDARHALDLTLVRIVEAEPDRITWQPSLCPQPTETCMEDPLVSTVSVPRDLLGNSHRHGAEVYAWLELNHHPARRRQRAYYYWRAVAVSTLVDGQPRKPARKGPHARSRSRPQTHEPLVLVRGFLHNTGKTFERKHDERLWVEEIVAPQGPAKTATCQTIGGEAARAAHQNWKVVLEDFASSEPHQGQAKAEYTRNNGDWKALKQDMTVFLRKVKGRHLFHPGMITREPYPASPLDLLPKELRPARTKSELTAVQRVFGWVAQDDTDDHADQAHQGAARFHGVRFTEGPAIPSHGDARWVLPPLANRKPSHFRFSTRNGQGRKINAQGRDQGFQAGHQLAGSTFYLHHRTPLDAPPAGGWSIPDEGVAPPRPYLTPHTKADQVIAFSDWIPAGATFTQRISFTNLRRRELAALLWVIQKPVYHHVGHARPLGFGTVEITISEASIQDHREYSASLTTLAPEASSVTADALVQEFDTWLRGKAPTTRRAILGCSQAYDNVRHPTLEEFTAKVNKPALPTF